MKFIRLCFISVLTLTMTACANAATDSILNPPTATVTPPPSPTIVWFPPSATPSPEPLTIQLPTPERKPGVGSVILSDDFSSPNFWNPASSNDGSAMINNNALTLAAPAGAYIFRIRADTILNNFYAELTASPSLCQDQDEYGLLIRASLASYYRLVLMCNGTLRLDLVTSRTHPILQQAIASSDVPTGAPGEVRMGVWAVDSDLRFFLNDRYQFSVTDSAYLSGTIGMFVHSAAGTPVTVSFSNLTIYNVTYSPPTKTPSP